jgi:hypothetical protein
MTTNNDGTDGDVKIYGRAVDERDSAGYVRFGDREEALHVGRGTGAAAPSPARLAHPTFRRGA